MPAFIDTPKKEALWEKAKEAANESHSESEGDSYWAIVNSIYQKMNKSDNLEKAYDDDDEEEYFNPEDDQYDNPQYDLEELGEGFHEIDPENEDDTSDQWLKENDPNYSQDYEEYGEDEEPEVQAPPTPKEAQTAEEDLRPEIGGPLSQTNWKWRGSTKANPEARNSAADLMSGRVAQYGSSKSRSPRFRQPTKEEIIEMRQHTRPLEQRARDMQRLQADPAKNPVLSHYGNIIEARNLAHQDRKNAYNALVNSDEYKNADPIAQMEMDDQFEQDWKTKNPEHLSSAMQAHAQAHKEGSKAKDLHAATKDAQIKHIMGGGAMPDKAVSTEEGLQHVGASREDDGPSGNITKDKAASFAQSNKEFINQYAKDYSNKAKKVKNLEDMENYNESSQKDIGRILGEGPAKNPKVNKFFEHYYPLIGMSARKVVNKLGLDPKSPDVDMSMLHEAGMHGLMQAINDYNHEHPSGASFASHASNKMRGLMHTALRSQDQIPQEVRQAQKKFAASQSTPMAPKQPAAFKAHPQHPAANDINERHRHITTQRSVHGIKAPGSSEND